MSALDLKCGRPSVLHQTAPTTARLHPSGLLRRLRSLSLPSEIDLKVLRTEGPRGLYKGSLAMFARLGPQTTITFVVCEQLRELVGMKAI
ncbi:hypothetical protein ACLB2K_019447 [Fragaria x ananassa]